jgi:hypothetical protein
LSASRVIERLSLRMGDVWGGLQIPARDEDSDGARVFVTLPQPAAAHVLVCDVT